MAISLCSALLAATLQAGGPPVDSVASWWRRVAADSTDGAAWLNLGRAYVERASLYHAEHEAGGEVVARARLDTADGAFARASLNGAPGARDTAIAYRVFAWGEATLLTWEVSGIEALGAAGQGGAGNLRFPAVLAELGENLLRACPAEGVLLTAGNADTYAAWFLRFARRMRPDLILVPLAIWRTDAVFRARLAADLQLPPGASDDATTLWPVVAARRPVCASMAFDDPPIDAPGLTWRAVPLVWVAGPAATATVPPTDFVFEATRLARDQHDVWLDPALQLYRRAAAEVPSLCPALAAFGLGAELGCVRTD